MIPDFSTARLTTPELEPGAEEAWRAAVREETGRPAGELTWHTPEGIAVKQ